MGKIADGPEAVKRIRLPRATKRERQYEAGHTFQGFLVAELRNAFLAVADPEDWRRPWRRTVPRTEIEKTKAAVRYFHGREAVIAADPGGPTVDLAGPGLAMWR